MDNNTNLSVICQCLQLLKVSPSRDCNLDYRAHKLFVGSSMLLFIEAQLQQRESYAEMSEHLIANESFQRLLGGLNSISASQLSRKMRQLPLANLHLLFMQVTEQIQQLTKDKRGITPKIGKLKLIDSTQITLPAILSKWAYCSVSNHGVKMHTSLVVVDAKTMYPDKMIASTRDIADHEVVQSFTIDKDATYVVDRGYQVYKHFQTWVTQGIKFVARVKENSQLTIVKERGLPKLGNFRRDADVTVPGQQIKLRLIEFQDNQGRLYRLVTNRWDLTAHQIAEVYRHRWQIELFFKWIKQHIRLVKPHGYTAEAIWNQMYIALIAYGLCLLLKLQLNCKQTIWQLLRLIRLYADKSWAMLLEAIERKPKRKSKGRPKRNGRPPKQAKKSMKPRIIVEI
ncbi:IS4 family transposase [Paenibacillus sp. J2TS4]|uniref:IS4 family transposase n=1 Tax=Paenibacillus sp. J2TS4 TaxID=2807194 RepID=UPI001AFCE1F1|nr:IS4 family transposase [Paenibacillus sp. J2TS4]GIP33196.1 IS4 family transposase ISDha2 [Paenibacillus sp. J2TS4]